MESRTQLLLMAVGCMLFLFACNSLLVQPKSDTPFPAFPEDLVEDITLLNRYDLSQEQIAYCSHSNDMGSFGVFWAVKIMSLDGSIGYSVESFAPSPTTSDYGCRGEYPRISIIGLTWSPDGMHLLFVNPIVTTLRADLAASGEQLSATTFLHPAQYTHYEHPRLAAWSPDGKWVAFVSGQTSPVRAFPSVFITSADGQDTRQITNEPTFPGGGRSLVWSHDSSQVAYLLPQPDNGLGVIDATNDTFVEFNPDNVEQFPKQSPELTADLSETNVAWLPGDRLLIFVTKGKSPKHDLLWLMEPDGSNLIQLYEGDLRGTALAPDGKVLTLVEVQDDNRYTIKMIFLNATPRIETLLDGSTWELATNEETIIRDLEWSPDGTRLIFASNALGNYDLFLWDTVLEEMIQITNTSVHEVAPKWRPHVQE